jgi:quercetin dioxygenase-like cupin family protein
MPARAANSRSGKPARSGSCASIETTVVGMVFARIISELRLEGASTPWEGNRMNADLFTADLGEKLPEIVADSIVSRTLFSSSQLKAVLFGFAPGQELSEHTASTPAVIHILSGQAELTLGGARQAAGPGTWVHMPAQLPHALVAQTEVSMLLLLLKSGGEV